MKRLAFQLTPTLPIALDPVSWIGIQLHKRSPHGYPSRLGPGLEVIEIDRRTRYGRSTGDNPEILVHDFPRCQLSKSWAALPQVDPEPFMSVV